MKKIRLFCLVIMLLLMQTVVCRAVNIFDVPPVISVNDYSVVLNENTKNFIKETNEKLFETIDSKVIFVTVPTTGEESIDEYCNRLYEAWGVSSIGDSSSTFVLLSTEDMEYWAIVGQHLSSALTRQDLEKILIAYMEPEFAKGNFDGAVKNTFTAITNWYTGHYNLSVMSDAGDETQNTPQAKSQSSGAFWKVFRVIILIAIIAFAGYSIIRRRLRLYAVKQRKKDRIQSYRKYSTRAVGSGDYEYFEFYDTKQ